jgi:hypothetical protein
MQNVRSYGAMSLLLQSSFFCILACLYHLLTSKMKKKEKESNSIASLTSTGRLVNLNRFDVFCLGLRAINFSMTFESESEDHTRPTLWLRERVRTVLTANPWLVGRLCKTDLGKYTPISLWVPELDDSETHLDRCFSHIEVENFAGASMKPPDSAFAASGHACIDTEEPLWKVTLITHKTLDKCVLFVSMCHVLGDACTFFDIVHMLSECGPGSHSMIPDRVEPYEDASGTKFLSPRLLYKIPCISPTNIIHSCFKTILCLPRIIMNEQLPDILEVIDPSWIEEEKKQAAKVGIRVSSNDIITSSILRTLSPSVGLMAVSVRNHLPHIRDNLAGNYVDSVALEPSDYATPGGVRNALQRALQRLKLSNLPRPSISFSDVTFVTNWASFFRIMSLPKYRCTHQEAVSSPPPLNGRLEIIRGIWNGHIDSFKLFRQQDSIAVLHARIAI